MDINPAVCYIILNYAIACVRKIIVAFTFLILHEMAIFNVLVSIVIFLTKNLITFLIL